MSSGLQPGDRVIDLRAVTRSGSIFAGLAAAPSVAWLADWPWWACVLAPALGTVMGFMLGGIVGQVAFPAPPGQTVIARAGAYSLGVAFRASLCGSLVMAGSVAVVAVVGGTILAAGISVLVGLVIGAVVGCLAALL